TAVALAAVGMSVVLACRNPDKAAAAAAEVRERAASEAVSVVALDLSDLASVTSCAHQILERGDRLDVLVNNAGGIWSRRVESAQGYEQTFAVNHLGPFALTRLLLDRLKASAPSRIVNLSSFGHHGAVLGMRWEDLNSEHRYRSFRAYAQSKLANILFTRALAAHLEGTGVTANAVHPGPVRSGFGMDGDLHGIMRIGNELVRPLEISPQAGAATTIHVATAPELEHSSGGYYARGNPGRMSIHARSLPDAERLWRVSEQLVAAAGFSVPPS
ncbi:MAG TPA: SDR family NAD(P)-dependent oxidoreductase, partial [Acidimicrobiales bacterium]|nr:SDR family NAD(P)-dependent oxidoreductase [Acidimicrobiales bacterium]